MTERDLKNYAMILIDDCLSFPEGGRLRISGELPHRELMLAAATRAYERGAREVRFDYVDARLARLKADLLKEAYLDEIPSLLARTAEGYAEEGWTQLSFVGEEDPTILEGADAIRLQRLGRARSKAVKKLYEAVLSNRLAWCVAPGPTQGWGRSILERAGRDPGPDPAESLWKLLLPILRLDAPDPAAAVCAHMEGLEARARTLDSLELRELHFRGPGTDLRIPLSAQAHWVGGGSTTPEGRHFYANIPTEEVFTTPDWRGVEGRASCTRPFELYGLHVEGAWLEFKAGEVVKVGAKSNVAAIERYLETDAGARRLGEVALVDAKGPIFKSGLVFSNGLIDENAACHIALGSAYDEAYKGIEEVPEGERSARGFNESLVHEDLMIGSGEVEVRGLDAGGREIPLLSRGAFLI